VVRAMGLSVASLLMWGWEFASCEKRHRGRWRPGWGHQEGPGRGFLFLLAKMSQDPVDDVLLKTPYRDGTTQVAFEPVDWMTHIHVRHLSGDLRSSKSAVLPICYRSPRRPDAQAAGQSHPLPWRVGTKPSMACSDHPRRAG